MAEVSKTSPQRLLVPLDGSPLAELALTEAVALSQLPNSDVTLLQVIPPIDDVIMVGLQPIAIDQQWELQKEQALYYLRGVWPGRTARRAGSRGRRHEAAGGNHPGVRGKARHRADRDVHPRPNRSRRWVSGSVADKVLRAINTTVVLVSPRRQSNDAYPTRPTD
jgi:nucleotide-binding universal stress UspA family protein